MKTTPCTQLHMTDRLNNSPRCLAKTRHNRPCQSHAVHGKRRCRLHGCGKGSGAPLGNNYAVTHGNTTAQVKAYKKLIRQTLLESMAFLIQSRQSIS